MRQNETHIQGKDGFAASNSWVSTVDDKPTTIQVTTAPISDLVKDNDTQARLQSAIYFYFEDRYMDSIPWRLEIIENESLMRQELESSQTF